ncbi:hypothetical protein EV182_004195, partial [Spiromyces aspiralis]
DESFVPESGSISEAESANASHTALDSLDKAAAAAAYPPVGEGTNVAIYPMRRSAPNTEAPPPYFFLISVGPSTKKTKANCFVTRPEEVVELLMTVVSSSPPSSTSANGSDGDDDDDNDDGDDSDDSSGGGRGDKDVQVDSSESPQSTSTKIVGSESSSSKILAVAAGTTAVVTTLASAATMSTMVAARTVGLVNSGVSMAASVVGLNNFAGPVIGGAAMAIELAASAASATVTVANTATGIVA